MKKICAVTDASWVARSTATIVATQSSGTTAQATVLASSNDHASPHRTAARTQAAVATAINGLSTAPLLSVIGRNSRVTVMATPPRTGTVRAAARWSRGCMPAQHAVHRRLP